MRSLLLVAALAFLGCKEKTSPPAPAPSPPVAPAEAGPAEPPPPPPATPADASLNDAAVAPPDADVDADGKVVQCCCQLPGGHELKPRGPCEKELGGTCVIARKCSKQQR